MKSVHQQAWSFCALGAVFCITVGALGASGLRADGEGPIQFAAPGMTMASPNTVPDPAGAGGNFSTTGIEQPVGPSAYPVYPQPNYPGPNYPQSNYPQSNYPQSNYPQPDYAQPNYVDPNYAGPSCDGADCVGLQNTIQPWNSEGCWFTGADFIFVRAHFSEATAFAQASMGPGGLNVVGQELNFTYEPSWRAFVGYRFAGESTELKFTYSRLTGDASVDGRDTGAGRFIVDPFGNVVGTGIVVDPNSGLFGQTIPGGDRIHTEATVVTNIYDLDLIKISTSANSSWVVKYSVGVRVADINQSYNSVIDDVNGAFFSGGNYAVDFVGAGPRLGLQCARYFGPEHQFSLFARAYGSLIVGDYREQFSQTTTAPPFHATQSTDMIRTVPVAETELGASWNPYEWLNFSAGWLFQAWFDMGTSGGKFGGFYTVTQNANIMSFDGLMARAAITF